VTERITVEVPVEVPVEELVEITRQVVATVQVPVEVTREVFIEVPVQAAAVGSAENPIRLVFAPIADRNTNSVRATALVEALTAQTGLQFTPVMPDTHADALNMACQAPEKTVAFLPSLSYVAAHDRCDLQIGFAGERFGLPWSASMLLVRSEREARDAADLADATWGVANASDLVSGLYFQALFKAEDVEVGRVTEYDTDSATIFGFLDDEVEFVTADFKPPLLPNAESVWQYGVDDPEIWRRTGLLPYRSGIGFVVVRDYVERGGYQVRDARSAVLDAEPFVFADTRILLLSEPIPNDAVAFGADFPLALSRSMSDALLTFIDSAECVQSLCSTDFFSWEGLALAADADYDPLRFISTTLEWDEADLLTYLDS
jgi:ABC-type phosphate/phosphonate transport system substrate-binding protein